MAHNNRNIESPRNDLSNSPSFDILYIDHNSSKFLCLPNAAITDKSSSPILTHEPSIQVILMIRIYQEKVLQIQKMNKS